MFTGIPQFVTQSATGQPFLLYGTSTTATAANRPAGTPRIIVCIDDPPSEIRADNDLVLTR